MINKVNFLSYIGSSPADNYNYRMNNYAASESVTSTLKETKPLMAKFDWLDIDNVIEFAEKTTLLKNNLLNDSMKKFDSGSVARTRQTKIDKEQQHIAKPVTERTAYNTKQLRDAGVKEKDINKYLTYDGHVNFEGKKILKEHGKPYK